MNDEQKYFSPKREKCVQLETLKSSNLTTFLQNLSDSVLRSSGDSVEMFADYAMYTSQSAPVKSEFQAPVKSEFQVLQAPQLKINAFENDKQKKNLLFPNKSFLRENINRSSSTLIKTQKHKCDKNKKALVVCETPYFCPKPNHEHCMIFACNKRMCFENTNVCSFHCEMETHKHCKELNCENKLLCPQNNLNICNFHCEKKKHNHCIEYACASSSENCKFHPK